MPCSLPAVDELVTLLSGSWLYCRPPGSSVRGSAIQGGDGQVTRVGLELTSDGHVYWLSPNASDTVIRGQGISEIAA